MLAIDKVYHVERGLFLILHNSLEPKEIQAADLETLRAKAHRRIDVLIDKAAEEYGADASFKMSKARKKPRLNHKAANGKFIKKPIDPITQEAAMIAVHG